MLSEEAKKLRAEYFRKYREENKERINANKREYYRKNKEKYKEVMARYWQKKADLS